MWLDVETPLKGASHLHTGQQGREQKEDPTCVVMSEKCRLWEETEDCAGRSTSALQSVLCVTYIDPGCLSPTSFQKFFGASQGREAPVGPGTWVTETADGLQAQLGVPRVTVWLWVPRWRSGWRDTGSPCPVLQAVTRAGCGRAGVHGPVGKSHFPKECLRPEGNERSLRHSEGAWGDFPCVRCK